MIWRSVCSKCGNPVMWSGEMNIQPDVPKNGNQKIVCTNCHFFGQAERQAEIPLLVECDALAKAA